MPEGAQECANCGASQTVAALTSSREKDVPPPAPPYSPGRPGSPMRRGTPLQRLLARVRGILFTPRAEWGVIASEPVTARDLYVGYVAPLAAVGALASLIAAAFVGVSVPFEDRSRLGLGPATIGAVAHFILTFAIVFSVAKIVDWLAPTFGGQRDRMRALQVTAYSFTPAWVAAALAIVPTLSAIATVIGFYALYLLYLGLPALMHAPIDKSLGFTVVVVICTFVLMVIVAIATGLLLAAFAPIETGALQV
jgi:hypothetical protein